MTSLEEQFEDLVLTGKEFQEVKRGAPKNQYKNEKRELIQIKERDKITYNIGDVRDLFAGTNISEEAIAEELSKIVNNRFKRNEKRKKILKRLKIAGMLILLIPPHYLLYKNLINSSKETSRYNALYTETLTRYADTDKNGIINSQEKDEFNYNILKGKGVMYNIGEPIIEAKYPDDKEVSREDLIKWIEEYTSSKSRK